ncbi:hypothetical protein Q4603_09400 [Zobellia galactanivorans]|uniref:Uncharacterized protein n=1 Tax=Zobellia galactanivorans (strain DSM 12802 / CCUG 47099 / CIP 106680 / NCIMB 13871 / Dsij) TaxID=63186 RepID=G0L3I4_ZOBGA|nr:hypothetical protein [Zobellia galactanivorans]MDO6808826.1 hypothetical protein [Zobellia galactanivorans]CAZ98444.1 Putative protein [Zobellia galactanivorans]
MEKRKNRITVHATENGKIKATIIQPEGKMRAQLVSSAGTYTVEITDHKFHGTVKPEIFMEFNKNFKVEWKQNSGKLTGIDTSENGK